MHITNPILPGFNADPYALRVGSTYYVITSTFNWFPGVSLYKSEDLKNWRLVNNLLNRTSQLDLRGNGESCGIWAPQISYAEHTGKFYLLYTDVKSLSSTWFDLNNYIAEADAIEGPYSEPVYVNSSGFDPSLFHDEDGRSYLLNLAWEFRKGYPHPGPIIIQEYDVEKKLLLGVPRVLLEGDRRFGCTEGPHMYRRNGYYYVMTAEGGTGYGHAVMVYRSRTLNGTFVRDPKGPLLTSRGDPHPETEIEDTDFLKSQFYNPLLLLQKSGHGSLLETSSGDTYLFHLCARPIMPQMRCILNRETAIQQVTWKHGWPELLSSHTAPWPEETLDIPADASALQTNLASTFDDFTTAQDLPVYWYSLRCPRDTSWCTSGNDGEGLMIRGRNSLYSAHDLSLIARRLQHFSADIECAMSICTAHYRISAGLILMTGSRTWYYIRKYYSERLKAPALSVMTSLNGKIDDDEAFCVTVPADTEVRLRCELRRDTLQFYFSHDQLDKEHGTVLRSGHNGRDVVWKRIGPARDATVLSDEFTNNGPGAFDGTFIGMTVQDIHDHRATANFRYFSYDVLTT
ncbi:MAG: glycoside hydrolase family 43 protein [Spirochaetia bacterium]|nr:glycoside hydrolase family 43 protein [Spirochaetia bacterium]